jgi:sugar transferase (PEP-CTERM/EpsH1 system associated)
MRHVLYLVHRIPYPPDKGDKIRSYHWLRYLAERFKVHLGTFVDQAEDWIYEPKLARFCESACVLPLRARPALLRSAGSMLTNKALSVAYYRNRQMARFVDQVLDRHEIDRIIVFSSTMAQYVAGPRSRGIRKVVDFVDVDSDKWRQYGERRSWPMSLIYRREGARLLQEERRIASDFDANIFTSRAETALFAQLAPGVGNDKLHSVRNGVDTSYFDPAREYPNPYPPGEIPIVFTGQMSYWPNVDAVTWFAREVLPTLRERVKEATFYVVGARPSQDVLALRDLPAVRITGRVRDIRPYLAHARLAVAPMRLARGLQNKVLEALAMGTQVLVSRAAVVGIDHHGAHSGITVADTVADTDADADTVTDADTMVAAALHLLSPDVAAGARGAGRSFVQEHYRWQPAYDELERIVEGGA